MATKKRKPGKSIPNAQRHTVQVLLRLPPETAKQLRDLAKYLGLDVSATVVALLGAVARPPVT